VSLNKEGEGTTSVGAGSTWLVTFYTGYLHLLELGSSSVGPVCKPGNVEF